MTEVTALWIPTTGPCLKRLITPGRNAYRDIGESVDGLVLSDATMIIDQTAQSRGEEPNVRATNIWWKFQYRFDIRPRGHPDLIWGNVLMLGADPDSAEDADVPRQYLAEVGL